MNRLQTKTTEFTSVVFVLGRVLFSLQIDFRGEKGLLDDAKGALAGLFCSLYDATFAGLK